MCTGWLVVLVTDLYLLLQDPRFRGDDGSKVIPIHVIPAKAGISYQLVNIITEAGILYLVVFAAEAWTEQRRWAAPTGEK